MRYLMSGVLVLLAACGGGAENTPGSAPVVAREASGVAPHAQSTARQVPPLAASFKGEWSPLVPLPLVPSSAAHLPNGKLLFWASSNKFSVGAGGATHTSEFDPATLEATDRRVNETGHDMYCAGIANLVDGSIFVSGGDKSDKTSTFDALKARWAAAASMNMARCHSTLAALGDGTVLADGGFDGSNQADKNPEIWSDANGWRRLRGILPAAAQSGGAEVDDGGERQSWLLTAPNGRVLRAGPGQAMNWIDTRGNGALAPAGLRGDDEVAQRGNMVMYDVGRALKVGGSPAPQDAPASRGAYLIDVNAGISVRKLAPMAYPRVNGNAVVLPNGQVMIIGGQTFAKPLSDDFAVLPAELWDPMTERFTTLPPMGVARNENSVALLLPDARVLSAGGGLCGTGCGTNHADAQVYTPHYLLNPDGSAADRPVLKSVPAKAGQGTEITVTTDSTVGSFALIRLSSVSHATNNDQRRIPLRFRLNGDNTYELAIPSNPNVVLPGYYMLFAMSERGVPSISKMIQITGLDAPQLAQMDNQISSISTPVRLAVEAKTSKGEMHFAASGLPQGLSINPHTGVISGLPTSVGQFAVAISVSNEVATTSTQILWTVQDGGPEEVNFVRLVALSGVNGNAAASMAEFNLLDGRGEVLPRTGWTVRFSSEEATDSGKAISALDGDPKTGWHSQYTGAMARHPHEFVVNLGAPRVVTGFKYLPRADQPDGTMAEWRFDTSRDGVNWQAVAQGNFTDFGSSTTEKTIYFNNLSRGQLATQSSTAFGGDAARAVDGNTNGNFFDGGSVSQTNPNERGWWQVDLGSVKPLTAIRLWNRIDCCMNQLADVHVFVSSTDMAGRSLTKLQADPSVWRTRLAGEVGVQSTLQTKISGRFVRVEMSKPGALALAEVQVFGASVNHAPVLAPFDAPNHVVGRPAALVVSATDPDGDAVIYAASGLPPGLSLDPASGVISGRPSVVGAFHSTLRATDASGASATLSVDWSTHPAPVTLTALSAPPVLVGTAVAFEAGAAAADGLRFQWDFGDGSPASDPVASARQTHRYELPGAYQVEVKVLSTDGLALGVRRFVQAVYQAATKQPPTRSSNLRWEGREAAPGRIWMVNPDNDSVTVFDSATDSKLAEVPTGQRPRSVAVAPDRRVWVVNQGNHSISVIDPASLKVAKTIELPRASQPYGLVFAPDGEAAYVVLEGAGQLLKLNPATGETRSSALVGDHARHVSVSHDSARVFVSRFVTPPLPGESTAQVQTQANEEPRGGEVLVFRADGLKPERTIVLQHSDQADSSAQGRGVPNYLGPTLISPDGLSAWVPSKQDNIKRGTLRDGQNLNFQNTVRAISSRIDLTALAEDTDARVFHDHSGLASDAVFHPTGAYLFVALQTSREIAVIDPAGKRQLFRVEAGRAPDGLTVSSDGLRLYVNNFMDRQLGVYDLTRLVNHGELRVPLLRSVSAVEIERLPADVLIGKQLFHDAKDERLARDGYLSCAVCHMDGGHDGRTWDFTGLGEGLRNTPSLRGHGVGQGALNWAGRFDEVQDFEGQIRALAGGSGLLSDAQFNAGSRRLPLGDKKAGVSHELDALAAYVASLDKEDPSPLRHVDGSLASGAQNGKAVFAGQCASCHAGSEFSDSALNTPRNVGTIKSSSGHRLSGNLGGIDTPTLRGVWNTAPYLHDGSAATIEEAVRAHRNLSLSASELASVAAYVQQIGPEDLGAPSPASSGHGLSGAYFANSDLKGSPVVVRTEPIQFEWGAASPADGMPTDRFSVRWTGFIEAPANGAHVLQTQSEDSIRVWLDGRLVIDNWTTRSAKPKNSPILNWTAGRRYPITVEYHDQSGPASAHLRWKTPGASAFKSVPMAKLYSGSHPLAENLARGKPATQSSTDRRGEASRAVDGNTWGVYSAGAVSQTARAANNWWQVDLRSVREIDTVHLWPRTDCCAGRVSDLEIFVSNTDMASRTLPSLLSDKAVKRFAVPSSVGSKVSIPMSLSGRYVRVHRRSKNILSLAEVEVMGR